MSLTAPKYTNCCRQTDHQSIVYRQSSSLGDRSPDLTTLDVFHENIQSKKSVKVDQLLIFSI